MNVPGKIALTVLLFILFSCENANHKTETKNETKISAPQATAAETSEQRIPQFVVSFPPIKEPTQKTEVVDTLAGNVLVTQWFKQGSDENGPFIYFVLHYQLPPNISEQLKNNPASYKTALESELNRSNARLGGSECVYTDVEQGSFMGMESICRVFDGEGFVKSRIFLVGNNFFIVGAGGKNIQPGPVDKFISSFILK